MRILLTNDDGINAPGLYALYQEMKEMGEVFIVAPHTEQSATAHAITLSNPLEVERIHRDGRFYGYGVKGTPVDCVKLAVIAILEERPDIVISGINLGSNLALDIIYSGTVSAAAEGIILGIPSIAVSLATRKEPDYSFAATFARSLCLKVKESGLPEGVLLNVNIPPTPLDKLKGVKITKQGKARLEEEFQKTDKGGNSHYQLKAKEMREEKDEEADTKAVGQNYISITPIHFDRTDYRSIDWLKEWNLSLKD